MIIDFIKGLFGNKVYEQYSAPEKQETEYVYMGDGMMEEVIKSPFTPVISRNNSNTQSSSSSSRTTYYDSSIIHTSSSYDGGYDSSSDCGSSSSSCD